MNLNTGGVAYIYDPNSFQSRFAGDWWNKLDGARQDIVYMVEPARSLLKQVFDWFQTDQGIVGLFVIALIGFGACVHILTRKGNGEMKQATVSDIFLEAIDLAYLKGQVTRTERRRLYKQMAEFFKATDLLNKQQSTARTKGMIRSRLGNGVYKQKPQIPGAQPFSIDQIKEKQVKVPVRNRMTMKSKVMRTQPA